MAGHCKGYVKATTFGSYEQMVKSVIRPYFCRESSTTFTGLRSQGTFSNSIPKELKTVKANSVLYTTTPLFIGAEICFKTDLVTQNVAEKVDRPKKNDYQPVFLDADELQHLFEVVKGTKFEVTGLVCRFLRTAQRRGCWVEMGRHRL